MSGVVQVVFTFPGGRGAQDGMFLNGGFSDRATLQMWPAGPCDRLLRWTVRVGESADGLSDVLSAGSLVAAQAATGRVPASASHSSQ